MVQNLSELYNATFKKNRGKAAQGLIRPTLSEFFVTNKDFTEIIRRTQPPTTHGEPTIIGNRHYWKSHIGVLSENKVLIVYCGGSYELYAAVITLTDNSISIGSSTKIDYNTSVRSPHMTVLSEDTAVAVCYHGDYDSGYVHLLNITGNTVTKLDETRYGTSGSSLDCVIANVSNNKVVVAFRVFGDGKSDGYLYGYNIANNNIDMNGTLKISNDPIGNMDFKYMSNNKALLIYRKSGSLYSNMCLVAYDGTTVYRSHNKSLSGTFYDPKIAILSDNKAIISFINEKGKPSVFALEVNESNIFIGDFLEFPQADDCWPSVSQVSDETGVIFYCKSDNGYKLYASVLNIEGLNITLGETIVFDEVSANMSSVSSETIVDNKILSVYTDTTDYKTRTCLIY